MHVRETEVFRGVLVVLLCFIQVSLTFLGFLNEGAANHLSFLLSILKLVEVEELFNHLPFLRNEADGYDLTDGLFFDGFLRRIYSLIHIARNNQAEFFGRALVGLQGNLRGWNRCSDLQVI